MAKSSSKVQFIKNVASGWLALFVTGIAGLVALPLNLKYLGQELFSISALAISTLALFSFLNMGLQPTLLRFFSHALVAKDRKELQILSSIAQFLLGGLGFAGAVGFLCTFSWFVSFYDVPETVRRDLFILYLAIAFDFWSTLFLIPFSAIIQGSNRFDIGNIRHCISKVVRVAVLFAGYSFFSPSLLILAAATFAGTSYQLISLTLLAYGIHGNSIIFHWNSLRWDRMPSLLSFSVLNLIYQVFLGLSIQLPTLIIGKTLGHDMVAAFYPAVVLSAFCTTILMHVSAPLVPVASKDFVENKGKNFGRWAILMGEITACIGCTIIVVFALLGSEIVTVWLGETFAWTGTIVTIIVTGIVFSGIQATNYRLALGGKFSIVPSALSSGGIVVVVALGTFLGTFYGGWSLPGVAVLITFARILGNAVFLSFSFSWQFGFRFADYTWNVYVKPLLVILSVIGIFFLMDWLFEFSRGCFPSLDISFTLTTCFYSLKWPFVIRLLFFTTLMLASFCVACVYLFLCWKFVLQNEVKHSLKNIVIKKFNKSQPHAE